MCYSPFIRIPVTDKDFHLNLCHAKLVRNGGIIFGSKESERFHDFVKFYSSSNGGVFPFDIQEIPCGQCLDCRIKHSQMWANRCMLEAQQYEHNYFITLTYDDEHLITNSRWTVGRQTGELGYYGNLELEDFTKFKKKLIEALYRATGHRGLRFFMCGEYGSKNGRPHFHSILFNCPLPDIKLHQRVNLKGFKYCYYTSELLSKCWDRGFVMIGEMCWETAAYVARYCTKKFHSDEEKTYKQYCELNDVEPLTPEFINMSRKPGIARAYYDEHKDQIYDDDNIVIVNGRTSKPFRYYDKLFELEDGSPYLLSDGLNRFKLSEVKAERKRVALLVKSQKYRGMTPEEVEQAESNVKRRKEKSYSLLKRDL